MQKKAVFAAFAIALCGCATPLKPEEVNEMLLAPTHGILGGIAPGDSWDKLKADHDKRYTVHEDTLKSGNFTNEIRMLHHDLGNPGEDGFSISVKLDANNNVTSHSASIYGRKNNAVVVRKVLDDVIAHFDKVVGNGHCSKTAGGQGNSSSCQWKGTDGTSVTAQYMETTDPITGRIVIDVTPAKK